MSELREYIISINIFALNDYDFNNQINIAIQNIMNKGLKVEINHRSVINSLGYSYYSGTIKGYEIIN